MIITTKGPQNVGQIRTHFKHGDLFLSPEEYQRENAWNLDQKRLLIDTIFRGMDIPKLYFWKINWATLADGYPDGEMKKYYKEILQSKQAENDDPDPYVFEVVDGQQRIRTILEFAGVAPPNDKVYRGVWQKPFPALPDTPIAKGKKYDQLNAAQQIKFDECPLTIMVLEHAKIDEIRDMFLRLQNGTPLNAQQKRDAMGSEMGKVVKEIVALPFFKQSVNFENNAAAHHLVAAQMFNLEIKGKIFSCTYRQLDKIYKDYINKTVDRDVVSKVKKVITVLGKIFPNKNPHLNRSYALSLFWALSRTIDIYDINTNDYDKIRINFEELDHCRLEASARDFGQKPADEIYEDLQLSMAHRTDGLDGISTRHDILTQYLFESVQLTPLPHLDPKRNYTHEEKLIIYRRALGRCQLEHNGKICGRLLDFDEAVIDHITPHSKGGKTVLDNGRLAYSKCNNARNNQDNFDPATMCHFK